MRALSLIAAALGAAAIFAGCGGGGGGSSTNGTTTHAFSAAADEVYSRAYSDCGSVKLLDLATRYKVKPQKDKVALAVATYWAGLVHGGSDVIEAGKEGCYDGYKARAQ